MFSSGSSDRSITQNQIQLIHRHRHMFVVQNFIQKSQSDRSDPGPIPTYPAANNEPQPDTNCGVKLERIARLPCRCLLSSLARENYCIIRRATGAKTPRSNLHRLFGRGFRLPSNSTSDQRSINQSQLVCSFADVCNSCAVASHNRTRMLSAVAMRNET